MVIVEASAFGAFEEAEIRNTTMKPRHRKIAFAGFALGCLSVAAALSLNAFNKSLVFYFTPSQVMANEAPASREFRLGGVVETGTLQRDPDGLTVRFTVSDSAKNIPVVYRGILPDLFKEGRGCVAQGTMGRDGVFLANQVLAKHDENYMPPGSRGPQL
jgi:cytochrome c-type biogenesis protein CcmE